MKRRSGRDYDEQLLALRPRLSVTSTIRMSVALLNGMTKLPSGPFVTSHLWIGHKRPWHSAHLWRILNGAGGCHTLVTEEDVEADANPYLRSARASRMKIRNSPSSSLRTQHGKQFESNVILKHCSRAGEEHAFVKNLSVLLLWAYHHQEHAAY